MIETDAFAPKRPVDLLVRATLAPEPEAKTAWELWKQDNSLDRASWAEVRVLGALAARIGRLETDPAIVPRVRGIRKFLWVHTQRTLTRTQAALTILANRKIPCLLFKGMARIVRNESTAAERLIRDADALVPVDKAQEALDALTAEGWTLEGWQTAARENGQLTAHHAWSLTKDGSDFDLHHFSNFLNRLKGDDTRLWARARRSMWREAPVWLPAPEDGLLIALAHGMRRSADGSADWAVDAAALLLEGHIDWNAFVDEVVARSLQAVVGPALSYLEAVAGRPMPEDVISKIDAAIIPELRAEARVYAKVEWPTEAQDVNDMFAAADLRARCGTLVCEARSEPVVAQRRTLTFQPGEEVFATLKIPQGISGERSFALKMNAEWRGSVLSPPATVSLEAPGLPVAKLKLRHQAERGRVTSALEFAFSGGLASRRGLDRIWFRLDFPEGWTPATEIKVVSEWRV